MRRFLATRRLIGDLGFILWKSIYPRERDDSLTRGNFILKIYRLIFYFKFCFAGGLFRSISAIIAISRELQDILIFMYSLTRLYADGLKLSHQFNEISQLEMPNFSWVFLKYKYFIYLMYFFLNFSRYFSKFPFLFLTSVFLNFCKVTSKMATQKNVHWLYDLSLVSCKLSISYIYLVLRKWFTQSNESQGNKEFITFFSFGTFESANWALLANV